MAVTKSAVVVSANYDGGEALSGSTSNPDTRDPQYITVQTSDGEMLVFHASDADIDALSAPRGTPMTVTLTTT